MKLAVILTSAACALVLGAFSADAASLQLPSAAKAVVGTWLVSYDGVHNAVAQWQKGGTSSQIVDFSAKTGNALLGDWTAVDDRNVSVFLTGWTYDDTGTNLTGHFTKKETDTVSRHAYSGNFEVTFYDLSGNIVFDHSGTLTAVRVPSE